MGSKKCKRRKSKMVIVQGRSAKDIKMEHEIKMLKDPNPTSPDGRVAFSPPELQGES